MYQLPAQCDPRLPRYGPSDRTGRTAHGSMQPMETPHDALTRIRRALVPGQRWPDWSVATPSGHHVGLITSSAYDPPALYLTIRGDTLAGMEAAGLLTLGGEETVPEYEGGRRGLRWAPGRVGRRLALTDAGRSVARPPEPVTHGPSHRVAKAALLQVFGLTGSQVVVDPPDEHGGRPVRVDRDVLGVAYSLRDVAAIMRKAGLWDWAERDVIGSGLIEWRGGGPDAWRH